MCIRSTTTWRPCGPLPRPARDVTGADARYVMISADCHAGAPIDEYRDYLEARYLDEFEAWSDTFVNPFTDLLQPDANRNWDLERRRQELLSDGVVGEV